MKTIKKGEEIANMADYIEQSLDIVRRPKTYLTEITKKDALLERIKILADELRAAKGEINGLRMCRGCDKMEKEALAKKNGEERRAALEQDEARRVRLNTVARIYNKRIKGIAAIAHGGTEEVVSMHSWSGVFMDIRDIANMISDDLLEDLTEESGE